MVRPVILHLPHASRHIPPRWRGSLLIDDKELSDEILKMTDSYTDELYNLDNCLRVEFPVSRLIVDPERFENDDQEPMADIGMGVVYTKTSFMNSLRLPPSDEERRELLETYYYPHHAKLSAATAEILKSCGFCLIIDCHSFPRNALPYEGPPQRRFRPDICIGTDSFHTPKYLADSLAEFFREKGYTVAIDHPFSGAITPLQYYRSEKRVMSVMIEVCRDLYMDEKNDGKTKGFDTISADLIDVMERTLEVANGLSRSINLKTSRTPESEGPDF